MQIKSLQEVYASTLPIGKLVTNLAFLDIYCKINTGTNYGIHKVQVIGLQDVTNPIKLTYRIVRDKRFQVEARFSSWYCTSYYR